MKIKFLLMFIFVIFGAGYAFAQTNEFTYQGRLTDGSAAANANYDFEFRLFDAVAGGTLLGTRQRSGISVSNGIFTVTLDFPAGNFSGGGRWLEIGIRPAGSGGGFQQMLPRQPITSAPYSIKSLNAEQLGGINASGFVQNTSSPQTANFNVTGSGTIGGNLTVNGTLFANLPAGDSSYVQNRTTQQSGTNFNISGNGTIGGTLNATTISGNSVSGSIMNSGVYRIGGENVLKNFGTRNIFVGNNAGGSGIDNSFFGYNAGNANLSVGIDNSFFGSDAGGANTSGTKNSFFGSDAGDSNTTGSNNTLIGAGADVVSNDLNFATAIGAGAVVSTDNTIILGRGFNSSNPGRDLVYAPGGIGLDSFAAGSTQLCSTPLPPGFSFGFKIGVCGSSIRFKTNVKSYFGGIEVVNRLRPVSYEWREDGKQDIGFIAEEVEQVEPRFATYDQHGKILGVQYGQITTVLINAVKEQQTQIETQQNQIQKQQTQIEGQAIQIERQNAVIDELKKLVCSQNREADICKEKK